MIKTTRRPRAGFTLIELLTVIAIIGILASIIIPTVGKVQQTARRTADSSNLRQIGQSSLIYAQTSRDQLPGASIGSGATNFGQNSTTSGSSAAATTKMVAAALAINGGLESGKMWVSRADDTTNKETENGNVGNVLTSAKTALEANFNSANLAFGYVAGLTTNYPATTPVAFTRGLINTQTTGKWSSTAGTYKDDGGHIVFIGGNVAFYKNLGANDAAGELINSNGSTTNDILKTVRTGRNVVFIEETIDGIAAANGTPGGGS